MIRIITAPNLYLNTVCEPIEEPIRSDTISLAEAMRHRLLAVGGMGLAAPQVAHAVRLFVMKYNRGVLTCINPEIVRRGKDMVSMPEGCLSIPGVRRLMERSKICDLEFTNLSGERLRIKLKDMDARCAQHEMDHLNGILITTGETPDEME